MGDIAWLGQLGAQDVSVAGGKGANLGELLRAGFPVPNGFVVTTQAYAKRTDDGGVPDDLAAEILDAYRNLVGDSGAAVAVRSSATAEDSADASFAGQQESYLGIESEGALLRAVADCWASLESGRAKTYRAKQGVAEMSLAAVVQIMVRAQASGVMFTANPVNGHREQTVITAAWGLGEAVVGGLVDPDQLTVDTRRHTVIARQPGDKTIVVVPGDDATHVEPVDEERRRLDVLDDAQALELSGIGTAIEQHFGRPQDIEWALDADGFHIVQARPITALPDRIDEVADSWPTQPKNWYFRASIVEQLPDPLTPLFADLVEPAVVDGLKGFMGEMYEWVSTGKTGPVPSFREADLGFPTINGYAYYRYSNSAMKQMLEFAPGGMKHLFAHGGEAIVTRWRDEQLPRYHQVTDTWRGEDVATAPSARLLDGVRELLNAGCYYYTAVQTIIPLAAVAEFAWRGVYKTLAGVPKLAPEAYLVGFDTTPILAEKALWRLGRWCAEDTALAAALGDPRNDALGECPQGVSSAVWDEWRWRLGAYLEEFGHTTYNLDFVNPVPADDPAPVLRSVRLVLSGDAKDPYARQAELALRRDRESAALLARLDPVRRSGVRKTLEWAQQLAPDREDALAAMGLAWPVMRRFLAELGRRLAGARAIAGADDVYWLTEAELVSLAQAVPDATSGMKVEAYSPLRHAQPGGPDAEPAQDLSEAIEDRKALWRGQHRLTPPQGLPLNAAMKAMDASVMPAKQGQQGGVLKGNAGSGGVVTGPARVVETPDQFGDFMPGEILVAPITTPAYTPLFAVAAGVVTDVGGILSHGSIVAREYGIPAVLGVGTATRRIHTGDVITVDGIRGQVSVGGAAPDKRAVPAWAGWAAAGAALAALIAWRVRRRRR